LFHLFVNTEFSLQNSLQKASLYQLIIRLTDH